MAVCSPNVTSPRLLVAPPTLACAKSHGFYPDTKDTGHSRGRPPLPVPRFPTGNAKPGGNAKPRTDAGSQRSRSKPFPEGCGNAKTRQRRHFPGSGNSSFKREG